MIYQDEMDAHGKLKPITNENYRKAIEILDEVSFPHPDQQWALEQLICAAHALGILGLRYQRLKESLKECQKANQKEGQTNG